MTLSIAGDYKIFDGLETLTFQQKQSTPVAVNYCLREKLNLADLSFLAGMGIAAAALVFRMWGPELPNGVTPQRGDRVTDSSSVLYVIQNVEYVGLVGAYRCLATKGY